MMHSHGPEVPCNVVFDGATMDEPIAECMMNPHPPRCPYCHRGVEEIEWLAGVKRFVPGRGTAVGASISALPDYGGPVEHFPPLDRTLAQPCGCSLSPDQADALRAGLGRIVP